MRAEGGVLGGLCLEVRTLRAVRGVPLNAKDPAHCAGSIMRDLCPELFAAGCCQIDGDLHRIGQRSLVLNALTDVEIKPVDLCRARHGGGIP